MKKIFKISAILVFIFLFSLIASSSVFAADFDSIQDEINLGNTSINLGNGTYSPGTLDTIRVNRSNIVIKGQSSNSKAILDGRGSSSRIMTIVGNNIHLENLIFRNVDARVFGGAVYSNGANLTIINCEFINNKAMIGAVLLDDDSINALIQNCTFVNNVAAYSNSSGGGGGGAMDSHSYNGRIIGCTFINNSAVNSGGALAFIRGGNNTVSGCAFINNTSPKGGAIIVTSNSTTLKIIDSVFNNNKASDSGGAVHSTETLEITNSNFTNNTAKNNGGAIYNNKILTINNSNFTNNLAKNNGGAVYNLATLTITSTLFSNNKANSRLTISVPYYVNCSNIGVIKATLIGGNNIKDGIYSNKNIQFNGVNIVPNDKIPNQNIILTVNGKNYNNKTNNQGIVTFNINTKGFSIKYHNLGLTYSGNNVYGSSVNNSAKLLVTQKKIVTTSYSPRKSYKKPTKKRYVKINTKTYKKVKARIETFYYTVVNKEYKHIKTINTNEMVNKLTNSNSKWVLWKKSNSKKYRWNYQAWITKNYYKRIKTTTTNLNGIISTNKKWEKYTVNSEKKINDDWTHYLETTLDCNVTNAKIKNTVNKLISQIPKNKRTDKNIANKIWQWNQKKIKYHYDNNGKPYGGTRYGSDGTYSRGGGNCIDHGHLAVAMFRVAGLPAQYKYKALSSNSAHSWAMVYLNGKWQHSDTVIKTGPIRGQKKWVTTKAWKKIEFVKVNYDTHKNLKLSNLWRSVYQNVYYPDGTKTIRYYL